MVPRTGQKGDTEIHIPASAIENVATDHVPDVQGWKSEFSSISFPD